MQFIKPGTNINFVGYRKYAFIFSLILLLVSIGSLVYHRGPNYGVDFAGGILIQAAFSGPTTPDQVRLGLRTIQLDDALIQRFGAHEENEFLIRAQQREGLDLGHLAQRAEKALEGVYGPGSVDIRRVEMVGPKVGADLRQKALLAMFAAILFIAVYISGRFETKWFLAAVMAGILAVASYLVFLTGIGISGMILAAIVVTLILCWFLKLRYALGAVVALIHDVIITVGILSLTGKEFTLPIVAALLAIIGYSLNDTIIVFDRIREKKGQSRRLEFGQVVNRAINDTLSRTILTSITTLIVVLTLFFLGGGVIHDFAFALMVGVLVGTYSSVFVAAPILILVEERSALPKTTATPAAEPVPAPAPTPEPTTASSEPVAAPTKPAVKKKTRRGKKKKKNK
ncbi:MAG: protein translocase subunit SecF [Deltaproteobacteria bacterium]|nr:protein translocase subunit SecF [Deltaproteobacteria bacterium]